MSKKIVVLSIVCVVLLFAAIVWAEQTGTAAGQTTTVEKVKDGATTNTNTMTTATKEVKPAAGEVKK
jgi:hypothetical protein